MRRYAAAIGILLGGAVGAAVGLPLSAPHLIGVLSLVGLIIGYVISQQVKEPPESKGESTKPDVADRLKELDKLRGQSLISTEEYEKKRREILDEL